MKFDLLNINDEKKYENVEISIDNKLTAMAFIQERVVAVLSRVRILEMAKYVLYLDGFESLKTDKHGKEIYKHSEWFLIKNNNKRN